MCSPYPSQYTDYTVPALKKALLLVKSQLAHHVQFALPKNVAQQLVAWKYAKGLGVSNMMDSVSCTVV